MATATPLPTPTATPTLTPSPTPTVVLPLPGVRIVPAFPELHGNSFKRPIYLTHDRGGRLYVLTQEGQARVFSPADLEGKDEIMPAVWLDLKGRITPSELMHGEEGFWGLAFDPRGNYIYTMYSAMEPIRSVVSRWRLEDSGDVDMESELVLLEIEKPLDWKGLTGRVHNGGTLAFGPDGYLYISVGNGGAGSRDAGAAQNTCNLLGSILRIDVHRVTPATDYFPAYPYSIPPDNPFAQAGGCTRPEVYAYGLRNPYRMSFDSVTGMLWAGDVGDLTWEEVDVIKPGANYGYDNMEGPDCWPPPLQAVVIRPFWNGELLECDPDLFEPPITAYGRAETGNCSIIGGHVYRGKRLPALVGWYVYGDFCSGRIWALNTDTMDNVLLADTDLMVSSFGVDATDEIYVVYYGVPWGAIYSLEEIP